MIPLSNYRSFCEYLAVERANHAIEHSFISLIADLCIASITLILLWDFFPAQPLLIWITASFIVSGLTFRVHRISPSNESFSDKHWQLLNILCSFFVGFTWGVIPVFFWLPENNLYFALIITFYTGYVSGALSVTTSFTPSFLSFATGITLPFAGRMFFEGSPTYISIGILSIFFVMMLAYVSYNIHRLFIRSVETQFNNLNLVEELENKTASVEQASLEKNRFLAAASHDLRQPLHSASLLLTTLHQEVSDEKQRQLLNGVSRSFSLLKDSFNSLLDLSKLEAGVIEATNAVCDIESLMSELINDVSLQASEKQLVLDSQIEACSVITDPILLKRVLTNLLANAIRYTDEGTITLRAAKRSDDILEISIRDTGSGIPKNELQNIFSEYYQLHNPERDRNKGFGLGLSIVKRLCLLLNIKLNVESTVGVGTEFTLLMPREPVQTDTQINTDIDKFDHIKTPEGLKVLVIDDNVDILKSMEYLLTKWKCRSVLAESCKEAIEKLTDHEIIPDIIISDYRLRYGKTGVDACEAICTEFNQYIPAVIVTGDVAPERLRDLSKSGYPVLNKPVLAKDLAETILKTIP